MNKERKVILLGFCCVAMLLSGNIPSGAADYPAHPVNLLIGYSPGGPNDLIGRAIAEAASPFLGQRLVVVNKPGASGSIAMTSLANSKNDGYTIANTPASFAVTPHFEKVPYSLEKDFTYIAALAVFTESFVVPADSPWKTLKELIDYSRANPDTIKIGASDIATSVMMLARSVGQQSGARWTPIPFKGDAAVITAILGGHIQAAVSLGAHIPHVKAGKLRLLANATEKRIPEYPDVPTLLESGFDLISFSLAGIVAPKSLPEPIAKKLEEAIVKGRETKSFQENMKKMSLVPQAEVGKNYESRVLKNYLIVEKYAK